MDAENQENQERGKSRDEQGRFVEGISGNPNGRSPQTLEEKLVKKATQDYVEEYKSRLAKSLIRIDPVLVGKAEQGDILAIKEIHAVVVGEATKRHQVEFRPFDDV